jgi:hypothetical protein
LLLDVHKSVLGISISERRNMLVAENLSEYVEKYNGYIVYSDDVNWYPEA